MRVVRAVLIVILIGIVVVILYAGWRKTGPNQTEAAFNPGGKVVLDLAAGGYDVKGTNENRIWVEVTRGDTRDYQCRVSVNGTKAKVEIDGPANNFHATIYVPQRSDLEVDQTMGNLVIGNIEGNKAVALGIGHIQLQIPDTAPLPTFDGSVLLGSLRADNWHVHKGGFFRDYYSRSTSPYRVKAHLDIGDLEAVQAWDSHPQKSGDADHDVSDQDSDDDSE